MHVYSIKIWFFHFVLACTVNAAGAFCGPNGTATGTLLQNNCACVCNAGYEGDDCTTQQRNFNIKLFLVFLETSIEI